MKNPPPELGLFHRHCRCSGTNTGFRHSLHGSEGCTLRHGAAEALEIAAHGTTKSSKVVGRRIHDVPLPAGCSVAALIRGEGEHAEVLMAQFDLVVEAEDRLIVFVPNRRLIPKIEALFAVDVGFF